MLDLILRGGTVVDGSGTAGRRTDVGISGDRISIVGPVSADAREIIDVEGLTVTPGFIDVHAHSDAMLLADPQHLPKLAQGVTTEILGQDGLSYAPLSRDNLELYRRYLAGLNGNPDIDWDWGSVADFRVRFDRTVAVNTAYLVPHGAIRLEVLGMRDTPMRGRALDEARELLRQGLRDGAVGFSTGLVYYPCFYSDTDELVELCRVVAEAGGIFAPHLRYVSREDGPRIDPLGEAIEIAERSGVALHLTHFRTSPSTAGRVEELLAPVDAASARGLDITLDTYPYATGSSLALSFLPAWAQEGGPEAILSRLADAAEKERIASDVQRVRDAIVLTESWDELLITHAPGHPDLVGMTYAAAGRREGSTSPAHLLCDLLLAEDLELGHQSAPPDPAIAEQLDRDFMALYSRPDYVVATDAILVGDVPHPRGWGTYPRLLGRLRRAHPEVALEMLVQRATSLPARRFGLDDRGLLAAGMAADLVVFDADRISDAATYEAPRQLPVGIHHVFVNGRCALRDGMPTGVLAGRALP